jgi:hypothetical protein
MKASKLKKRYRPSVVKAAPMPIIIDEFHMLAGFNAAKSLSSISGTRRAGSGLLVTQSVGRGKRGKTVFSGSARYAETGLPFPSTPKKFLPVQVLRRLRVTTHEETQHA